MGQGRFDEAIALCEQRLGSLASQPATWAMLAGTLVAARRPEAALRAWEAALDLAPADPALLCGKAGVRLQALSRSEEEREPYRRPSRRSGGAEALFGVARLAIETRRRMGRGQAMAARLSRRPGAGSAGRPLARRAHRAWPGRLQSGGGARGAAGGSRGA